jgi:outer membrane lipase/esterase
MHVSWLRRALLAAACVSAVVVAACGGGTVVSQFTPARLVSFGDAFSDLGVRGVRYTINDTASNWNGQLAARYGRSLAASPAGLAFGTGNARVNTAPDAAGDATTLTIAQQVSGFLAAQSFLASDLVVVNGGTSDIVVQAEAARAGSLTDAQALAATRQAATDLAVIVKRIVDSGAQHVGVVGTYDMGRSPYAAQTGQGARLSTLSSEFNIKLKTELFGYNIADRVLYIDAEYYYNLVISNPNSPTYASITNVTVPACDASANSNAIDPGPGIGTGPGQVNSARCNSSTITPGINPAVTLFADGLYFTPIANSLFGDYAFDRIRTRW